MGQPSHLIQESIWHLFLQSQPKLSTCTGIKHQLHNTKWQPASLLGRTQMRALTGHLPLSHKHVLSHRFLKGEHCSSPKLSFPSKPWLEESGELQQQCVALKGFGGRSTVLSPKLRCIFRKKVWIPDERIRQTHSAKQKGNSFSYPKFPPTPCSSSALFPTPVSSVAFGQSCLILSITIIVCPLQKRFSPAQR